MFAVIEYAMMCVLGAFLKVMETACEAWAFIKEYETMRSKGYRLMTNDKGEDFWVGYGD